MEALARLFGDISLLKKGPEHVPSSINLLFVLLLCNFIVETFLGLGVYSLGFAQSALLSIISVMILMAFTGIWLMLFRFHHRIVQTLTTFIGISLFINLVCFFPVTLVWKVGLISDHILKLIYFALIVWTLSIYAHIYRKSLNISFFLGFALAITCFITINTITTNFLGA